MSNAQGPEQEPEQPVLNRQQRKAIERARKEAQKPLALQPMSWRMNNAERRIAHLERLLINMANLLVEGKMLEAHVINNQTVLRVPAPRRPWWKRLFNRA
jgi:hypothetical protein